jgi:hypothetical protein
MGIDVGLSDMIGRSIELTFLPFPFRGSGQSKPTPHCPLCILFLFPEMVHGPTVCGWSKPRRCLAQNLGGCSGNCRWPSS